MGDREYLYRFYRDEDQSQVEAFRCAARRRPWEAKAQVVIREAPSCLGTEEGNEIFVAVAGDLVVGVVVCAPDPFEPNTVWIKSLGTHVDYKKQGIATNMKYRVMGEFALRTGSAVAVVSEVHKYNIPMLRLNDKLEVSRAPSTEHGKYFDCVIQAEPDIETQNNFHS